MKELGLGSVIWFTPVCSVPAVISFALVVNSDQVYQNASIIGKTCLFWCKRRFL
jgi:hypothetical protein